MPSFNVQNAKSLEITEGDVATIHDADGRQLWGKLNYTTKYQGDTTQQTYSGKNLVNYQTAEATTTATTLTLISNGFRSETNEGYGVKITNISVTGGTTYSLSWILNYVSQEASGARVYINKGATSTTESYVRESSLNVGTGSTSFTTDADETAINIWFYNGAGKVTSTVEWTYIQLETGSTATTYEPYVGGVPSPNPDYPQPISVVTGTQTVTLTGGTVSEDYTVHLGTLELAKLATYQDYIFKSNGNWYKHTVIGKAILTGDADESWAYQSGDHQRFTHVIDDIKLASDQTDKVPLVCDHFTTTTVASIYNGQNYAIASHYGSHQIWVSYFTYTSSNDFKTWLSTHNTTLYYPLDSTAVTDTQITDTDLIAELDAIEEFMTRCGYTASVAGNLPIVINQTEIV